MERVLIIGGNGSGKSTFARQLAHKTALPLCHLDSLYWTGEWQPRPREEFLALLNNELQKPRWILDGNMRSTLPTRLSYCDTVIYLDFSGIRCFFGVLRRILQYHGKVRPDMGGNCTENFNRRSREFLKSTLSFNRKNRAAFYAAVREQPHVRLIVVKNRREIKRFLQTL